MRSLLAVLAAVLMLGACGTTEAPAEPSAASAAAKPITITDNFGRQVKLDKPATRVVGLEWGEIEMLLSVGVMPVGVADVKGYGTWVTAAKLDSTVKDVGTRQEPSVDSIAALQPDLVVMEAERDTALVKQLEKFVPVLVLKGSDSAANFQRMRDDLTMIATAVGKTDAATKVMGEFDAALAAGKQKIAAAGAAGSKFIMADGYKEGSTISIRLFGKGSLVSDVATGLGLVNAWTGKVDPAWGLGTTDIEGLTPLKKEKDLRFFYNASDGEDVFTSGLQDNAIWKSLPFVTGRRVTKLPNGIWTFGGPLSCTQYAEALVKAYSA